MPVQQPFNFKQWMEDNRHLLKPPVGNQQVYKGNEDFIVMVVGGPNSRSDYHINSTEELFYQVEGNIILKIIDDGQFREIKINEGDLFLLPPNVPHSPQRPANTIGVVIERYRGGAKDGFAWFDESTGEKIYEEFAEVNDIVAQLPPILERGRKAVEEYKK